MLIELTRPNIIHVLFKKRRLITRTALTLLALTFLYCVVATPQYEADGALVVSFTPMPSGVPGQSDSATQAVAPVDHEEIINSYTLELQSADLARQVISEIGVEKVYPPYSGINPLPYLARGVFFLVDSFKDTSVNPKLVREKALEDAVSRFLKKDLDIKSERNSNVITIALRNKNRDMAVQVTNRLIGQFVEREGKIDRDPRLGFIRGRLDIYRRDVANAQAAMEAFQLQNGISSMDEERTALIQERANLEQSIIALHSTVTGDEKKYQTLSSQIQQLSPVILTAQNDRDPLQITARSNLAELQARESALRQAFSENSQAVQDVRNNIKAAQDVLSDEKSESPLTHAEVSVAYQQIQVALLQTKAELDSAREAETTQRQQLDKLNERLATRDKQEGAYQDAVRDYQLADQNYRLYLQGVESARVADDLNKQRITSISVYDNAYASTRPAKPKWLLLLVLGAIGGLITGLALAFVAEALDEGFSTPAQISTVLKIPVLGSMTRG
jgi:uncharacterized protein involved in exopolysaccharide biosynthesis